MIENVQTRADVNEIRAQGRVSQKVELVATDEHPGYATCKYGRFRIKLSTIRMATMYAGDRAHQTH